ncbi:MAG: NAD(P)H-hydrate dehydratase [Clostridia bacterium]|nr:NAD(P)H-hydrate dehydratase [Clostridia bacterium]
MKLAESQLITEIDSFAEAELGIPTVELMRRAGAVVARVVREHVEPGSEVIVLAGKGNNGGDGYAAAIKLIADYRVLVYDVFAAEQSSSAGKHFLERYRELGGAIENYAPTQENLSKIKNTDCIIDAVFGTGFKGQMPDFVTEIAIAVCESVTAKKFAIDVPLGVNADNGSVHEHAVYAMATIELSYIKPGMVSYPAKAYVGELVYDTLSLPLDKIEEKFEFKFELADESWARSTLMPREDNSNKGTFGKLLTLVGSERYRGAARLALAAALRSGVGLVNFLGTKAQNSELLSDFPEVVYTDINPLSSFESADALELAELSRKHSAILVGSGSSISDGLVSVIECLLSTEGSPVVLDADAINSLSEKKGALEIIRNSKRAVILTPHPLEFARLSGNDVSDVQLHRIEVARKFAAENRCILLLKGAATVVTDGDRVIINDSGSSALAKAGSGDVLAGLVGSLLAQGYAPLSAAALSAYLHGKAGDRLARKYSSYGVAPSDIPTAIAEYLGELENS